MTAAASERVAAAAGLTPLDLVCGFLYGTQPGAPALSKDHGQQGARPALEAAVLRALLRPPCVVSFSGGRDSSAVLALAAHVATREGLQPPVPVTLRFPDAQGADEADWQHTVIRHLGIKEWQRVSLTDEIDIVGPYAQASLRTHGLLWPYNAYFHSPIADHARGGTVLTGVGGDEVMLPGTWSRIHRVARRQVRPAPRDVVDLVTVLAPRPLRKALIRRTLTDRLDWLEPPAEKARTRAQIDDAAAEPLRWDRWVREVWWPNRARIAVETSLRKITAQYSASAVHPFEDPEFLRAIAREGGAAGFPNRTYAMRRLFTDLLPLDILRRRSKAFFDTAFHHRTSRAFAAAWDGRGVDERWVNPERLRVAWTQPRPDGRSALLMQALWLAGKTPLLSGPLDPRGHP